MTPETQIHPGPVVRDVQETSTTKARQVGPFREFVLKVHSRCNLGCDYCYMYTKKDQSWRQQPRLMSPKTVDAVASRIGEHAEKHELDRVSVVFHGGEPLLVGKDFYPNMVSKLYDTAPSSTNFDLNVQTNGTLLTRDWLNMFRDLGIAVGVSIDGMQSDHDKHRKYHNGEGSYEDVVKGIHLLGDYPDVFGGIISVVDTERDPVKTYRSLLDIGNVRDVEFLLQEGHWSELPPHVDPLKSTEYADWLIPIFDEWYTDQRPDIPDVRLFSTIIDLLVETPNTLELYGLEPPNNIFVEANGQIISHDGLKSISEEEPRLGITVFQRNAFDKALEHPKIQDRLGEEDSLSEDCKKCELVEVCGGGFYPHRYREDATRFQNLSVYCADLFKLITHIEQTVRDDIAAARTNSTTTAN